MPINTPESIAAARAELNVPADRFPRHAAIIMDGNGRWALGRGLPRPAGHRAGAKAVRRIVTEASRMGLEALTLYGFSLDNWRRPAEEVAALMNLFSESLQRERPTMLENNVRFRHVGRREGLPEALLEEIDTTVRDTQAHTGMWLNLALNYGSRAELTAAARALARRVAAGQLAPEDIQEATISGLLGTAGQSDPDLVIRTAGEMRLSNFLLWQISYAEFHVTPVLWPDFDEAELHKAIRAFAARRRRFGGLDAGRK
jgi:undecaprenyl diphosphate synthase